MRPHPPWLRFQAYLVGLPKTGSTSVATLFGRYRSRHEWQLTELLPPALARYRGALDDEGFLRATGTRFVPPTLEMDAATCHHLYADLLRDTYPHAVFVHTLRDVRGWATSVLDMGLRKRLARQELGMAYTPGQIEYARLLTGGIDIPDPDSADDRAVLPGLLAFWASHVRGMADTLPAERTLRLRTRDLSGRHDALARLVGVPTETLRADLDHSNRAPATFDRFRAYDGDALRDAYAEHCADLMAELFPEEHAAWWGSRADADASGWQAYVEENRRWSRDVVARYGEAAGR